MAEHHTALPVELVAALHRLARERDTTLAAVLTTAHVKVLATVTGEQDVATGYVAPGSATPAVASCRVSVEPGTWEALVADIAATVDHETALPPAPAEGRHDTVLDLSHLDGDDRHPPQPADEQDVGTLWTAFHGAADGFVLLLRYRLEAVDHDHAGRLAGYYLAALRRMTAAIGDDHDRHSLLSQAEVDQQLHGLAGPRVDLGTKSLVELFEEQVRARPDATAAAHGDARWSYRELNQAANHMAHALLAAGLRPEDPVAVAVDRNLAWLAALLGVLKAGGAYLPIRPDFPADRIARQLRRSESRFVVTQGGSRANVDPALAALGRDVTVLLAGGLDGAAHPVDDPRVPIAPDQLAYIYFTSGSTGEPKGAMCEHAGMLNHLYAKIEDLELGAGDTVAQTASQCFDISLWQAVAPLLVGGSTRIVPDDVLMDARDFVDHVTGSGVPVIQVVPSYLDVLLSYLEGHPRDLHPLRCVSVTGEALKTELVQRWFALYPGIKLVNAYGATEVCDDTMHEVLTGLPQRAAVPVGRSLRNVHTYVVDERLRLVPLGSRGEIVFSGICVGRGYVNDEARTEQAFVPDPYRVGARMYRTGDFGRWLPEGKIEFLGRIDEQVKIRGFRIEIGELESQLLAAGGVRAAAVVTARAHSEKLVAFYSGDRSVEAGALHEHMAAALPEYMVPAYFHRLDTLPLNENGKVDKPRLRELASTLGHAGAGYVAPRTPTEDRIANAWAEILGVPLEQVGRDDGFFELGGTSLAAVRLVVKLDRLVSLQDITTHPRLQELAACADQRVGAAAPAPAGDELIQPLSDGGAAPRSTLVCVPYAGGNAINFQALAQQLQPSGIAVRAVELPGHDFAAPEQRLAGVEDVARRVRDEIERHVTTPMLLWGHGSGAAVALAIARLLEKSGLDLRRVFLGAALLGDVDDLTAEADVAAAMSDQEVTARLSGERAYVEFDGLRPERARLVGSAYRHDVAAGNEYLVAARRDPESHRVRAPLTVVLADDDDTTVAGDEGHRHWELLADDVELRRVGRGGHCFVRSAAAEVAGTVRAACSDLVPVRT